jgi:hypothetical protein
MTLTTAEEREAWLVQHRAMMFYCPTKCTVFLGGAYTEGATPQEAIARMQNQLTIVEALVAQQPPQKLLE